MVLVWYGYSNQVRDYRYGGAKRRQLSKTLGSLWKMIMFTTSDPKQGPIGIQINRSMNKDDSTRMREEFQSSSDIGIQGRI